ncbi:UNVERIFIED_CONTAM: Serine/threonine-protein phosphatase 4 regulatory subunit 1 [Trichonephila clavipes]
MLGHDIIMEDLLPKFLEFLTDVDEVRQSVVLQIPDFLCHVPSEERCQFFVYIKDFLGEADSMKWRFRCSVAEQLSATLKLCNPYSIEKYFVPVALTLLQDKVFSVRLAAAEFMANIIKNVLDDTQWNLLSKLDVTYRQAHKWNHRQMYVFVCEQLAKKRSLSVDTYVEEIVPKLFSLAWDIVPNVRLAVSRCIALTLLPLDYLTSIQKTNYDLLQVLHSLLRDIDLDVRHFGVLIVNKAPNIFPDKTVIHWALECI